MWGRALAASQTAPAIGPIDPALIAAPLDYFEADNNRRRVVLAHFDSLARGLPALVRARLAPALGRYLAVDLPGHMLDVEQHLLPLLRRRALPEDEVEALAGNLCDTHAASLLLSGAVVSQLARLASPRAMAGHDFAAAVAMFVAVQRRSLATESTVMLPLARARLDRSDLKRLSRAMARRHQGTAATPGSAE